MQVAGLRAALIVAACLVLGAGNLHTTAALAWGRDGHAIVAEIAEQYLEPDAAKQVRELLALENVPALAQVSNWADEVRPQRGETAPWHYVNIPIKPGHGRAAYDAARDCGQPRSCVVAKIEQFQAVLANKSLEPQRHLEALKFLVHFVADVHQPLHAIDKDRGGNETMVRFEGATIKLHALWDTDLLEPVEDERAYARTPVQGVTEHNAKGWRKSTPAEWATESYDIAKREIFGDLPTGGVLPQNYRARMLPVANEQLAKGGVRLASILNSALR